jgi:hypothetical protein
LVVFSLDPSHHAKTTRIVEVDGLEPEEAEVDEVYPVAAIFMARKVPFYSSFSRISDVCFPKESFCKDIHLCSVSS